MFGNKAAQQKIIAELDYKASLQLHPRTPDLWKLEQKRSHLIFIHDDMMQLQPHHDLVRAGSISRPDADILGSFFPLNYGYTTKKFTFVKKNLGLKSFPIALQMRDKDNLPGYMCNEQRIRGEIYAIRPRTFIALDNHRQNGVEFDRIRVNINIGYRKLMKHTITDSKGKEHSEYNLNKEEMITQEMFMYVGREEYWKPQMENGFFDFQTIPIVEEDRVWLTRYYQYSRVR